MPKLAINGGQPALLDSKTGNKEKFKIYQSYGLEEKNAAIRVIESGVLSQYIGAWHADFMGGPQVRKFETDWSQYFNVKHSIVVNSATSGLIAAVGALGLEPGDEVIVPPFSMSATATCVLFWGGVPVFADIEDEYYALDPASVLKNITPRTKGIIVADIFGHAAKLDELSKIAKAHGLFLIEDAAQAPGVKYGDQYVGTIADIGIFSLNYHKHIHTGEGGVCVTNNTDLADKMQMIRNHAEAVALGRKSENLVNMVGYNFRLGEIEAAMGIEQLKKLPKFIQKRFAVGSQLAEKLNSLSGVKAPKIAKGCTHSFYSFPIQIDPEYTGVSRGRLLEALTAEGLDNVNPGYANLHLLPMYQKKIAMGSMGFPWKGLSGKESTVSYAKGICPVAERLHDSHLINFYFCKYDYEMSDVDKIVSVFEKVLSSTKEL